MAETLIKVEGLSKKFCRDLKKSMWYGMQDIGRELTGSRHGNKDVLRAEEFWAAKDISFELRRGECLGLIGHNGAGKTTLLRMLNGLIKPDQGLIEIRGKVGALIALGAGFNPILTGRENIYINAAVLGMSKQYVDSRIDEIIDFAELREFINAPVQSYSSGMSVRLGFAIAVILIEPDILLLDEVLAVGDIGFTIKCLNAVRRMTNESAVVFVSHNMQQISAFCTRVMLMSQGAVLIDSQTSSEGINQYFSLAKHRQQTSGTGAAEILALDLKVGKQFVTDSDPMLSHGSEIGVRIRLLVNSGQAKVNMHVHIADEAMNLIITMPLCDEGGHTRQFSAGSLEILVPIGLLELSSGKYSFTVVVLDSKSSEVLTRVQGLSPFQVNSGKVYWGRIVRHVVPGQVDVLVGSL